MKYTPPFTEKENTITDSRGQIVMTFEQEDAVQRVEELTVLLNMGWSYIKLISSLGISSSSAAALYVNELSE